MKRIKKSDRDKQWAEPRRDAKKQVTAEHHLIISEGTETEPNYFDEFAKEINKKFPDKIKVIPKGKGKGTTDLLQDAINEVNNSEITPKHVWIVYDKDDYSDDSFDRVKYECDKLNRRNFNIRYHAIWNLPNFEYWILLNFVKYESKLNKDTCLKKVREFFESKQLGVYNKNNVDNYQKLLPYLEQGIKNSKEISENYDEFLPPSKRNPSTEVYKIFEYLREYI